MTAQEFIKQYGWDEAKFVISEWNNYFNQYEVIQMPTHYDCDLEIFVHVDDFKNLDDSDICIKDLKQLVYAWELVEKHGGLDMAKKDIIDAKYLGMNDMIFGTSLTELKQAIELVESVNENQD